MIETPIIVHILDENTIEVYPSVEAAEASMEAVDVEHGLYVAYDCHGCELKIVPDGYVGRLQPSDKAVSRIHELRPRLLRRLECVAEDAHNLREASVQVLLSAILATQPKPKTDSTQGCPRLVSPAVQANMTAPDRTDFVHVRAEIKTTHAQEMILGVRLYAGTVVVGVKQT